MRHIEIKAKKDALIIRKALALLITQDQHLEMKTAMRAITIRERLKTILNG